MMMRILSGAILAAGMLASIAPAFAADSISGNANASTDTNSTVIAGTNNTTKAESGNGSNGAVGDNPDATASTDRCFRRTHDGNETRVICPRG